MKVSSVFKSPLCSRDVSVVLHSSYEIRGVFLNWSCSVLFRKVQAVEVNNKRSTSKLLLPPCKVQYFKVCSGRDQFLWKVTLLVYSCVCWLKWGKLWHGCGVSMVQLWGNTSHSESFSFPKLILSWFSRHNSRKFFKTIKAYLDMFLTFPHYYYFFKC